MRESQSALWRGERALTYRDTSASSAAVVAAAQPALVEVLWRLRLTLALCALLALLAGGTYLVLAPRVYRATSTVMVVQGTPKALSETPGRDPDSDSYLQTQADI